MILASYAEYKLLFLELFFSNYWPLLPNILAVSQVPGPSFFKAEHIYIP